MKFNLQFFTILFVSSTLALFKPGKVSFSNPFGRIYNYECQSFVNNFNAWLYCIKNKFGNLTDAKVKEYFKRDCNGQGYFAENYEQFKTREFPQGKLFYTMTCLKNKLEANNYKALKFIKDLSNSSAMGEATPIWRQIDGNLGNQDLRQMPKLN